MAATIPCPACGTDNAPDAVRCHVCDYELRAQLPGPPVAGGIGKCPRCGSGVAEGAAFCQVCGQSVEQRHPRPHTGALNVREMFGPPTDQPRASNHAYTQAYAGAPAGGYAAAPALPQNPAAAPSEAAQSHGPRGRRRPAPAPRPNYPGAFGPGAPGHGGPGAFGPAGPSPAPSSAASPGFGSIPSSSPPSYPEATHDNLPRARQRPDAHAEAAARPQTGVGFSQAAVLGQGMAQSWMAQPPAQPGPSARAGLRLVLVGRDGQEGESFPIPAHGVEFGRAGGIAFPSDPFVSPQHAKITPIDGGIHLADLGSRNGVYLRLSEPVAVYPGDLFLLGNQLLRLDRLAAPWQEKPLDGHEVRGFGTPAKPPWAMLTRVCVGDIEDDRYHLRGTEITIGREQGEIVFPSDGFLSRAHARVRMEVHDNAMSVVLEDLDSANGTYLRIRGAVHVGYGGMFRVGDQIFRLRNS
jgi:pSer/pThr/pTyr-binding forkhead associated (FHA) protein